MIPRSYQLDAINIGIYEYFRKHPYPQYEKACPILALPTGTGKSSVIAFFLQRAFWEYPYQKVIVGTHVKELVGQNYDEFKEVWANAPAGIYSSGLKRKDTKYPITFAGVQSLVKNIQAFGKIDLFIIDECHLLSPNDESNYMKCLNYLWSINPLMKVIGLSATPWREGIGLMDNGGTIFTDISINMCSLDGFNWFIRQGYLCPLVPMRTETQLDVKGVRVTAGDYNEKDLQKAVDKETISFAALEEAIRIAKSQNRTHWLVFASGIDHTEHLTEMLNYLGVEARCVHSKMAGGTRDKNILEFKQQKYTAIVSNGILTTGFNDKAIDLIIVLRPTMSSKLWVQLLGRGTRTNYAPGFDLTTQEGRLNAIQASMKHNCLVLDFARNTARLGPINDPVIPRKKGEPTGEVPVKECDCCGVYNHISARFCGGRAKDDPKFDQTEGCGEPFIFRVQIEQTASTDVLIKDSMPVIEDFMVHTTTYVTHHPKKAESPPCVKVTYFTGARKFSQFVLFEHFGNSGRKRAEKWWSDRFDTPCPMSNNEAIALLENSDAPTHVRVRTDTDFPEVLSVCFLGEYAKPVETDDIPF